MVNSSIVHIRGSLTPVRVRPWRTPCISRVAILLAVIGIASKMEVLILVWRGPHADQLIFIQRLWLVGSRWAVDISTRG